MVTTAQNTIPSGYKQTDIGVIPEDWETSLFSEIVKKYIDYRGRTPKKLGMEWGGGDILALSANNVQMGKIDPDKDEHYGSIDLYKKWMVQGDCEKDDVLLTMEAPLGNVAQIPDDKKYILSQRVILIKPRNILTKNYLAKLIAGSYFQSELLRNASGSTAQGIQRQKLDKIAIFYPNLIEEQTAIADVLSDSDSLIDRLEELITKKKNIKKGAMQQLLTGKRRLPGFRQKPGNKQTEVGVIPEDWDLVSYGQAFDFLRSASYSREQLKEHGPVGYVHYGDIHTKWNHFLDLDKNILPAVESSQAKIYDSVREGDLIVADASEDYEGVAKSVEVKNVNDKEVISGLHTFLLRGKPGFFENGFKGYIHSNTLVKTSLDRYATGMKVFGVSRTNLKQVYIPKPSSSEQIAIATILSEMDADIEALKEKLTKYKLIKIGMMQQLLTGKIRIYEPSH